MKNVFAVLVVVMLFFTIVKAGIIHITSDFVNPKDDVITYQGSVVVEMKEDNIDLFSEVLKIFKVNGKWNELKASTDVKLKTENIKATSEEFFYRTNEKEGYLNGNVMAVLTGQDATITTNRINIDLKNKRYYTDESVKMKKGDFLIDSRGFEYLGDASKVTFNESFQATRTVGSFLFISGSDATLDLEKDEMNVRGPVKVVLDYATITSSSLTYDMESKGEVQGDVEGTITRNGSITTFKSDLLDFDTKKERFVGKSNTGNVYIWREKTYIEARQFIYDKKAGILSLGGPVYIEDRKNNVKIWAEKVEIYMDEDEMKAWRARTEVSSE